MLVSATLTGPPRGQVNLSLMPPNRSLWHLRLTSSQGNELRWGIWAACARLTPTSEWQCADARLIKRRRQQPEWSHVNDTLFASAGPSYDALRVLQTISTCVTALVLVYSMFVVYRHSIKPACGPHPFDAWWSVLGALLAFVLAFVAFILELALFLSGHRAVNHHTVNHQVLTSVFRGAAAANFSVVSTNDMGSANWVQASAMSCTGLALIAAMAALLTDTIRHQPRLASDKVPQPMLIGKLWTQPEGSRAALMSNRSPELHAPGLPYLNPTAGCSPNGSGDSLHMPICSFVDGNGTDDPARSCLHGAARDYHNTDHADRAYSLHNRTPARGQVAHPSEADLSTYVAAQSEPQCRSMRMKAEDDLAALDSKSLPWHGSDEHMLARPASGESVNPTLHVVSVCERALHPPRSGIQDVPEANARPLFPPGPRAHSAVMPTVRTRLSRADAPRSQSELLLHGKVRRSQSGRVPVLQISGAEVSPPAAEKTPDPPGAGDLQAPMGRRGVHRRSGSLRVHDATRDSLQRRLSSTTEPTEELEEPRTSRSKARSFVQAPHSGRRSERPLSSTLSRLHAGLIPASILKPAQQIGRLDHRVLDEAHQPCHSPVASDMHLRLNGRHVYIPAQWNEKSASWAAPSASDSGHESVRGSIARVLGPDATSCGAALHDAAQAASPQELSRWNKGNSLAAVAGDTPQADDLFDRCLPWDYKVGQQESSLAGSQWYNHDDPRNSFMVDRVADPRSNHNPGPIRHLIPSATASVWSSLEKQPRASSCVVSEPTQSVYSDQRTRYLLGPKAWEQRPASASLGQRQSNHDLCAWPRPKRQCGHPAKGLASNRLQSTPISRRFLTQ